MKTLSKYQCKKARFGGCAGLFIYVLKQGYTENGNFFIGTPQFFFAEDIWGVEIEAHAKNRRDRLGGFLKHCNLECDHTNDSAAEKVEDCSYFDDTLMTCYEPDY